MNPLRDYKKGERLRHETVNTVNAYVREQLVGIMGDGDRPKQVSTSVRVKIQNNSGAEVDQYGILGIEGVAITRANNEAEFDNGEVVLDGVTPAVESSTSAGHTGKFAIIQEPIDDDKIGLAIVAGVTRCKVLINNEADAFADILDGESDHLESGASGAARILHVEESPIESGEDVYWCLVLIGGSGIGGLRPVFCDQFSGAAGSDGVSFCTFTYDTYADEAHTQLLKSNVSVWGSSASTPAINRQLMVEQVAGNRGLQFELDGTPYLLCVNEKYLQETCDTPAVTEIITAGSSAGERTVSANQTMRYDASAGSGGTFTAFAPPVTSNLIGVEFTLKESVNDATAITLSPNSEGDVTTFDGAASVSVGGPLGARTWRYSGDGTWMEVVEDAGGGAVSSVNTQTGDVVLDTDDVAEGATNFYFSNALAIAAMPVTTRGDLLFRDATTLARLPIGTTAKYLRSDGTDPSWQAVAYADVSGTPTLAAIATSGSASDLSTGTVPDARFPATLPAASGVNLTALNATNLASGTVADARLSANVALENAANAFTEIQTVTKAVADATTHATFTQAIPTSGLVNGYTGAVGYFFAVPVSLTVSELGRRYHTGNSANHQIKLWDLTTGSAVATATVLAASSSDGDGFKWVAITPIVLSPAKQYAILSDETSGGDTYNDLWNSSGYFNRFVFRYAYGAAGTGGLPTIPTASTSIYGSAAIKFTAEITAQLQVGYDATNYISCAIRSAGNVAFIASKNDKGIGFACPVVVGKGEPTAGYVLTAAGSQIIRSAFPCLNLGDGTNNLQMGPLPSSSVSGISMRWSSSFLVINSNGTLYLNWDTGTAIRAAASGGSFGFAGATPVARQTVTGSRGGNAALASLLTAMANFGWITDSSTA